MSWLTPDRIQRFIQIVTVLLGLWTGSDATNGLRLLSSQPTGIVGADIDDTASVAGNGIVSILALLTAANAKRLAEWLTGATGSPRVVAALLLADLGILHELRGRTNSPEQRAAIRETAIDITSHTLFPATDQPQQGGAN